MRKNDLLVLFGLLALGISSKISYHEPNFAPLGAIALFSGFYFKNKYSALIPLAVLVAGDFFVGFYQWEMMASVYASFALISLLGIWVGKKKSVLAVWGGSLVGSVLFFLVTNFAVWAFGEWYPRTISGLTECFYAAVPFFRNTAIGDLFFNLVLFGTYVMVTLLHKYSLGWHSRVEGRNAD